MNEHIIYVGLGVHKVTISVAMADGNNVEKFANTERSGIRLRLLPALLAGNLVDEFKSHGVTLSFYRCQAA